MAIIAEICEMLKTSEHLAEFDKGVLQLMGQLLTQSVTEALERLDKELIALYLVDGWEIDRLSGRASDDLLVWDGFVQASPVA